MPRPHQTHCKRGHLLEDAYRHQSRGYTIRDCRVCHGIRARLQRQGRSIISEPNMPLPEPLSRRLITGTVALIGGPESNIASLRADPSAEALRRVGVRRQ